MMSTCLLPNPANTGSTSLEHSISAQPSKVQMTLLCFPHTMEQWYALRNSGGYSDDQSFLRDLLLSEEVKQGLTANSLHIIQSSDSVNNGCTNQNLKHSVESIPSIILGEEVRMPFTNMKRSVVKLTRNCNAAIAEQVKLAVLRNNEVLTFGSSEMESVSTASSSQLATIPTTSKKRYFRVVLNKDCKKLLNIEAVVDVDLPDNSIGVARKRQFYKDKKMPFSGQIRCKFCEKLFRVMGDYTEHKKTHITELPSSRTKRVLYNCVFCGQVIQKSSYALHLAKHEKTREQRGYWCPVCDGVFGSRDERIKHETDFHGAEMIVYKKFYYSCTYCDAKLSSLTDLCQHLSHCCKAHGITEDKIIVEDESSTKIINYTYLSELVSSRNFHNMLACPFCPTVTMEQRLLLEHILEKHVELNAINDCSLCCATDMLGNGGLPLHVMNCHVPRVWICQDCSWCIGCEKNSESQPIHFCKSEMRPGYGNGFTGFYIGDLLWYKCEVCAFKTTTFINQNLEGMVDHLTNLDSHTELVKVAPSSVGFDKLALIGGQCRSTNNTNVKDGALKCFVCGHVSQTNLEWKKHNMECKTYFCKLCSEEIVGHKAYTTHRIKVHYNNRRKERRFLCNICGRAYPDSEQLKDHTNMHTGQRPYKCPQCPATFKMRQTLRSHMFTHSSERKHVCKECNKAFTRSETLKKHMMIHTGERPYSCHYCGVKFLRRYRMVQHVDKTHGVLGP